MNIEIGEKIKQLRLRDWRRQEDLANVLGVSPQAVSRWESGGGYPDLELLPPIANYFNVSIDELFGYSNDRKLKLRSILKKADEALSAQEDMAECIEMLRSASEEFPSEPQILIKLGFALSQQGMRNYGLRSYTKEDSDYAYPDTEYNSGNIYWQEELKIFEKVLSMDISSDEREAVIIIMITAYTQMGYNDKAKALAQKQNSIIISRECLLPKATVGNEQCKYSGEAIIALLFELRNVIISSVFTRKSIYTTPLVVKLLIDLIHMYESVFSDGRCGVAHYEIAELYMYAAEYESLSGSIEKALEYLRKGIEHINIYESIRNTGEYKYTAPLVSGVTFPSENMASIPCSALNILFNKMHDVLKEAIRKDPVLSKCFMQ